MKELAVAGVKNTPAAIRALKNTTSRLTKAASEKFLVAFMRLEIELKDLRSSKKSVEELFKLRDQVVKEGKASFGEEWYEDLVRGVSGGKHANWVEVVDIRNKILAKRPHVLRMDINASNTGFKGCHSKIALDDYIANNPTATYEFRSKIMDASRNGVYEANPIIKLQNGTELVKTNNAGKSTFFPDTWDEAKILDEVEYAIANNHGKVPDGSPTEYFGYSRNGQVRIHFYLTTDGRITSYFPVKVN